MTISPAKFFECLAMSRLIITRSKLTIFKGYDEHILFLDDLEQINYKILRSALEKYKNNSISRINHKDQNTWIERFKGFDNFLIEEFKIG